MTFSLDEYLADLEHLVNLDSHSLDPEGVGRVAAFFRERFSDLGWQVTEHIVDESVGPCLEIVNRPVDRYDFLLLGHMDTVFPRGTAAARPFRIRDDRAFGPGVADMQSGLLSIYHAVRTLQQDFAERDEADREATQEPAICVALNSDEEISSRFSRRWVERLARKSRYAFVFESARPGGGIVVERKGVAKYALRFAGRAAHAGEEPEKGVSAIGELGHWIVKLHALNDPARGTTVNVGVVSGGTGPNVVAEQAEAKIDIRFTDEAEFLRVETAITALAAAPVLPGAAVSIERLGQRPPWNPDERTRVLQDVFEAVGHELGVAFSWICSGAASDANLVADQGTTVIDSMGPVGGRLHSDQEYLEVASIEPKVGLIVGVLRKLSER